MDKHFKYKYDDLFNPTLKALKKLGDSGAVSENEEEVAQLLNLSEEETNEIHRESTTKLAYRLAWARNYLKQYGLIMTTGSFTREAKKEAQRDGATPIDLIDGNDFAEKLKELNLGVTVELVEEVKIKPDWFKNI